MVDKNIIENNVLPIEFNYQIQKEVNIINEKNTIENIEDKALEYSKNKLKNIFKSDEYIYDFKILNSYISTDKIKLNVFFSVIENITDYEKIVE